MINKTLVSGLAQPEGPAFDTDGRLFVVEMDASRACVSLIEGGAPQSLGSLNGRPTGLAIDGDDCLWVAGGPDASLVRLDRLGRELLRIVGDELGPFLFPNDLAFGPDGLLYMTDSGMRPDDFISGLAIRPDFFTASYAGTVFQIDPVAGRVLRRIDKGLRFANGLAFGADGDLYVSESLGGAIWRYSIGPEIRRRPFCRTVLSPREDRFEGPDGMAFDVSGRLYCAMYGEGDVLVISPDGVIDYRLATNGGLPTNVAFSPDAATIVVTEVEHGAVEILHTGTAGASLHRPKICKT